MFVPFIVFLLRSRVISALPVERMPRLTAMSASADNVVNCYSWDFFALIHDAVRNAYLIFGNFFPSLQKGATSGSALP